MFQVWEGKVVTPLEGVLAKFYLRRWGRQWARDREEGKEEVGVQEKAGRHSGRRGAVVLLGSAGAQQGEGGAASW